MSDQINTNTMSDLDNMRITVRAAANLEEAATYLDGTFKVIELTGFANELGIEKPASVKPALIEQIIAKVTSGEEANINSDDATVPEEAKDEGPKPPEEDEADPESGVLSGEEVVRGVSLPAKVASYPSAHLWTQILGWEIDQKLDADARATYTEDELREYLAYLWNQGALGQPPSSWSPITDYEFRGIDRGDG